MTKILPARLPATSIAPRCNATPRRLKDVHSPAAVRLWVPTAWPEIGGPRLDLKPDPRFAEPIFTSRFIPGERTTVYIAGCRGLLSSVAQLLHIGAWKISTTQDETPGLQRRLDALGTDRYGSTYWIGAETVEDPHFSRWGLSMVGTDVMLSPGSPLRILPRGIEVILPADLDFDTFERLLRQALSNAELGRWVTSWAGRAHCARFGLSPSRFERFSPYNMACGDRMSRAREIFLFKPAKQSQRLVRIIETLIIGHVLAGP
ncbi:MULTISPECIES: hypothetical protein [Hyphomicrobiales]|jgi:hypothetical protein|uniref:hypothetical protein n=1 Tax=Methylobacterium sp. CCH7-A2 TaxID=1768789 RepID=UPI000830AA05|nr:MULTISPECIES: hypothetical protein [Hyphomicrobiales]